MLSEYSILMKLSVLWWSCVFIIGTTYLYFRKDKLVLRYLSNSNNKYPDYNNKYNQHPHEFENKRYDVFSKDSMTEKVIEDQNLKLKSSAEKSICKNDVHKSLDSDDQMTSKRFVKDVH